MQERSFSGKILRPAPEVHIESDGSFGCIVTPWGPRSSIKRVTETLNDFISSAKNDIEATSPFQMLTCLSPIANTLRAAVMLTNDILYREENKGEYLSGVELMAFARNATEFAFVQVGQPHVFLSRKGSPLIPLGIQLDLSMEWSSAGNVLSSLPHEILGLNTTSNIRIISFRPSQGDSLIFVSRMNLPPSLFELADNQRSLEDISELLAKDNPNLPYWLGVYELPVWEATLSEEVA